VAPILIREEHHCGRKPNSNRLHLIAHVVFYPLRMTIQSIKSGCMLYLFNLCKNLLCGTVSNAFSKSVYSTSIRPPFSNFSVHSSNTFKSCWTVERPLMNPYCFLLSRSLLTKNCTLWSRIMDSSILQHMQVKLIGR